MSLVFRRILQRFMKPTYLVGRDLEGNKYYEYPSANDARRKRTVQYKQRDDMWTYVTGGKRLPVQWNAWLTHTRRDPPSIEELQADLARQHHVQMKAVMLEAHDKEERERIARVAQPSGSQASKPPADGQLNSAPTPVRDPWAEAKGGSDEPQSWTPVVRRK